METQHINADNPVFIEIGIQPSDLAAFGVKIVAGQSYSATSSNEVMLGWTAAANLGLHVGDHFQANGTLNTVVGIYSTGNAFGDAGAMFPLPAIQGYNRLPGIVTLAFVKVRPGYSITAVAARVAYDQPQLTTIRTANQFGRADTNLVYLQAAVNGSTVLAILIGAIIVGNTMLLSLFERTREFGLLRAFGWTRRRTVDLVAGRKPPACHRRCRRRCGPVLRRHDLARTAPGAQGHPAPELHGGSLLARPVHRSRHDLPGRPLPDHPCRHPLPLKALSYE